MQKALDFVRKNLFPDIKDWSSSQDELRYRVDYWNMKWFRFITFHHLGTRWFLTGTAVIFAILCLWGFIWAALNVNWFFLILFAILCFVSIKAAYFKVKEWKNKATWTLYDMFLRNGGIL